MSEKVINLSERQRQRLINIAEHIIDTLKNDKYILPDRWDEDVGKLAEVTDSTFVPAHSFRDSKSNSITDGLI